MPALSSAFDTIEAAFASHREEDESLLTMTTTHTFANTWLAWTLGSFQMGHLDLAVRMTTSNELVDLRSGDADVAIRAGRRRLGRARAAPVVRIDLHPDGEPRVRRRGGAEARPQARAARHLHQNRINPTDDWWQQWFADNGVPADEAVLRRPRLRLENQANEGHAAMAGLGFALLTPLLWKGDVAAGRLTVPFPDRVSARGWAYWLVYPKERRTVPKVKRFREWLLPEMQASLDILTNSQLGPNAVAAE